MALETNKRILTHLMRQLFAFKAKVYHLKWPTKNKPNISIKLITKVCALSHPTRTQNIVL